MVGRKSRPASAAIAPPVCLTAAPVATPNSAHTHSSTPSAATAPATPGWVRDRPWCLPDRIPCTRKKDANAASSPATSVTAPVTAALAASGVARR